MNSQQVRRVSNWLLAAGAICLIYPAVTRAQVQSSTSVQPGAATTQTKVERGEAVYVSGNNLVVRMENGEIRHFNVPDNVTVTVDGKELTVHELKPGMKLQRTITTTTTPKTITTVKTVKGTVWNVTPPLSVILTLEDGTNKQFKIPNGQKFMVDGQETDAFGLKKGMKISATSVTEVPETVVAQQIKRTGIMPPPPPAPPADTAMLVDEAPAPTAPAEPAQVAQAEPAPSQLPKTGSDTPLLGLLAVLSLVGSLGAGLLRRLIA
jgi:LPXTG-motif cell wall-anchored protein